MKAMMKKLTKKHTYLLFIFLLVPGFLYYNFANIKAQDLPKYSSIEIASFNGSDANKPVYLALNGYVYDVSAGRNDFYNPGESYNYLVGRDSSNELNLFGGEIIKRKYKVVGIYTP